MESWDKLHSKARFLHLDLGKVLKHKVVVRIKTESCGTHKITQEAHQSVVPILWHSPNEELVTKICKPLKII